MVPEIEYQCHFQENKVDALFQELEGMKIGEQAGANGTPSDDDKCTAEGLRVVKLLLEVMKEGKMSGCRRSIGCSSWKEGPR